MTEVDAKKGGRVGQHATHAVAGLVGNMVGIGVARVRRVVYTPARPE